MNSDERESPAEQTPAATDSSVTGRPLFRPGKVAMVAAACGLVFAAVVFFLGVVDGRKLLNDLMETRRVAATGQVFYQGKPLANGVLSTQPLDPSLSGAMGFLDDDGKFELATVRDGNFRDGAYVGEHKVTVTLHGQQFSAGTPPLTPGKYAAFDTTPLTLKISKNASENEFTFTLEDDPNEQKPDLPRRPTGPPGGASGGPGGGGGGPPSIDAMFERLDANGDGKITEDEAPARFWGRLSEADADGDNAVSKEEMKKARAERESAAPASEDDSKSKPIENFGEHDEIERNETLSPDAR